MATTKDKVEHILKQGQVYCDNDEELVLKYWEMQGLHLSETQKSTFISKCTGAEDIVRQRRIIQGEGRLLATEGVRKGRSKKAKRYQETKGYYYVPREED